GQAVMMLPTKGTSRYCVKGAPLYDPEADTAFFEALKSGVPQSVECIQIEASAEDPIFVDQAVDQLLEMLAQKIA
ncbi:MAG: Tm-1-like ATP-binding domain-containing protein, partial [Planctomycetota bacterium]|nr:Tm-1-like ATP-binding domain-containing protein [Planctomycetota bacterium]